MIRTKFGRVQWSSQWSGASAFVLPKVTWGRWAGSAWKAWRMRRLKSGRGLGGGDGLAGFRGEGLECDEGHFRGRMSEGSGVVCRAMASQTRWGPAAHPRRWSPRTSAARQATAARPRTTPDPALPGHPVVRPALPQRPTRQPGARQPRNPVGEIRSRARPTSPVATTQPCPADQLQPGRLTSGRAQKRPKTRPGPDLRRSGPGRRGAEAEGFEPSMGGKPQTALAVRRHRPD